VNERLEYTPRRTRVVVLEDEDDLAGLIQLWLARRGLKTVPISGDGDAAPRTPSDSSRRAAIHAVGGGDEDSDTYWPEPATPSVVIVADAGGAGLDGEPWLVDVNRRYSDLEAWVDALQAGSRSSERDHIRLGPLDISSARRSVRVEDADVHLTPTEFRLLCYLVEHADRVIGHSELLRSVWGVGYEEDIHLLQVTIRSLRARIELVTDRALIESVYGVGYRMATCPVDDSPDA
jgi:DNA-binding winged helix-turn-helix (wHTH) protein